MKEAIKTYFEELIKTDAAMKEAYSASKLEGCCSYIREQAYKMRSGNFAAVKDEVVYKWARDYMLGDVPEITPAEPKNEKLEIKAVEETKPETVPEVKTKKEKKEPVEDEQQMLFEF